MASTLLKPTPAVTAPATTTAAALSTTLAPIAAPPAVAAPPPAPMNDVSEPGSGAVAEDANGTALELEPAARSEEERLHRAVRDFEDLGDLLIAAPFQLAHDERGALVEREPGERVQQRIEVRPFVVESDRLRGLLERDLAWPAVGLAPAHPADVVRDRDQPVVRLVRPLAALEGAVGIEEGRLRGVLRVGRVRQQGECVLIDLARVLAVEPLERRVGRALQ